MCARVLDQEALPLGGDWRGEDHVHGAGAFRRGTHEQVCPRLSFLCCGTPGALQGRVPEDLWPAEQVRLLFRGLYVLCVRILSEHSVSPFPSLPFLTECWSRQRCSPRTQTAAQRRTVTLRRWGRTLRTCCRTRRPAPSFPESERSRRGKSCTGCWWAKRASVTTRGGRSGGKACVSLVFL